MSAGGEILTGQQEEHAREIAKQEVASFARLLADELERRKVPADQAMPFRDEWVALHTALRRFNEGEVLL